MQLRRLGLRLAKGWCCAAAQPTFRATLPCKAGSLLGQRPQRGMELLPLLLLSLLLLLLLLPAGRWLLRGPRRRCQLWLAGWTFTLLIRCSREGQRASVRTHDVEARRIRCTAAQTLALHAPAAVMPRAPTTGQLFQELGEAFGQHVQLPRARRFAWHGGRRAWRPASCCRITPCGCASAGQGIKHQAWWRATNALLLLRSWLWRRDGGGSGRRWSAGLLVGGAPAGTAADCEGIDLTPPGDCMCWWRLRAHLGAAPRSKPSRASARAAGRTQLSPRCGSATHGVPQGAARHPGAGRTIQQCV